MELTESQLKDTEAYILECLTPPLIVGDTILTGTREQIITHLVYTYPFSTFDIKYYTKQLDAVGSGVGRIIYMTPNYTDVSVGYDANWMLLEVKQYRITKNS
jgi:hypothetical protein